MAPESPIHMPRNTHLRTFSAAEALHILDRFHIVAKMNKAVDEVRAGEIAPHGPRRIYARAEKVPRALLFTGGCQLIPLGKGVK